VQKGLNDFLHTYGKNSASYNKSVHPYAVFDFDNTTSIMDVEGTINHLATRSSGFCHDASQNV